MATEKKSRLEGIRPAKDKSIGVRVPSALHDRIEEAARDNQQTKSEYIFSLLKREFQSNNHA